ncbi:hypothetical protein [Luethyella okanaganae]|uniref:SRPBCC family protein n=1 Tax=Luethyella okanaganae TaxID=69372 RepID=A0ABW1VFC5_9MICO
MRVLLKLVLDCDPDAAWRAIRSPAVLREVVTPWLDLSSLEPGGFPTQWSEGEHRVRALAFRSLPVGDEVIDLSFPTALSPGVRMMRDGGGGRSGIMAGLRDWDHRMAVSPDPGGSGGTLYRDRLIVRAGVLTPAIWYSIWAFWQWRGHRLRQLAPSWSFEPELSDRPQTAVASAHG